MLIVNFKHAVCKVNLTNFAKSTLQTANAYPNAKQANEKQGEQTMELKVGVFCPYVAENL